MGNYSGDCPQDTLVTSCDVTYWSLWSLPISDIPAGHSAPQSLTFPADTCGPCQGFGEELRQPCPPPSPTPASRLEFLGPSGGFWAFWKPGRTVPFRNVRLDVDVSCKRLNPEQVPSERGIGQQAWGLDCPGLCHGLGGGC